MLVLSGVARLLFGLAPRWMVLAWVPLVFAAVVMLFGDLFQIPQWLQDVSPFEHVPELPAQGVEWPPLVVLTLIAAALATVGLAGLRRRDAGY